MNPCGLFRVFLGVCQLLHRSALLRCLDFLMVRSLRLYLLRDASDEKSDLLACCRQKGCPAVFIYSSLLLTIFEDVKTQTKLAHLVQDVLAHSLLVLHLKLAAVDREVARKNDVGYYFTDEEVIRQKDRRQSE